jgi:hypothetical protein
MTSLKDVLTIFARHTNWQDEGDRETVADFLDRNPGAVNTFGPATDENAAIRDDVPDDIDEDKNPS